MTPKLHQGLSATAQLLVKVSCGLLGPGRCGLLAPSPTLLDAKRTRFLVPTGCHKQSHSRSPGQESNPTGFPYKWAVPVPQRPLAPEARSRGEQPENTRKGCTSTGAGQAGARTHATHGAWRHAGVQILLPSAGAFQSPFCDHAPLHFLSAVCASIALGASCHTPEPHMGSHSQNCLNRNFAVQLFAPIEPMESRTGLG